MPFVLHPPCLLSIRFKCSTELKHTSADSNFLCELQQSTRHFAPQVGRPSCHFAPKFRPAQPSLSQQKHQRRSSFYHPRHPSICFVTSPLRPVSDARHSGRGRRASQFTCETSGHDLVYQAASQNVPTPFWAPTILSTP